MYARILLCKCSPGTHVDKHEKLSPQLVSQEFLQVNIFFVGSENIKVQRNGWRRPVVANGAWKPTEQPCADDEDKNVNNFFSVRNWKTKCFADQ